VIEFLWIDWNRQKVDNHALSTDEVEFAWRHGRRDLRKKDHPNGEYWESIGKCPSGRRIMIVWRYNQVGGENKVFVMTAY
jgi:hypothetical protein